jgi:hypothetical protein
MHKCGRWFRAKRLGSNHSRRVELRGVDMHVPATAEAIAPQIQAGGELRAERGGWAEV